MGRGRGAVGCGRASGAGVIEKGGHKLIEAKRSGAAGVVAPLFLKASASNYKMLFNAHPLLMCNR